MTTLNIFLSIIGIIISWIILYYVIKAAVRNGIKEAQPNKEPVTYIKEQKLEKSANPEQTKLQRRYDNGEITFEVYKSEWNKLST